MFISIGFTKYFKWNINDVKSMSFMFHGCLSLSSLSCISKWNVNITNTCFIIDKCLNIIKKFK